MSADDFKLCLHFPVVSSPSVSYELRHNTNILPCKANSWDVEFAPDKCIHLRICRGLDTEPDGLYFLDGNGINWVFHYKDLSVMINTQLRFHRLNRATVS